MKGTYSLLTFVLLAVIGAPLGQAFSPAVKCAASTALFSSINPILLHSDSEKDAVVPLTTKREDWFTSSFLTASSALIAANAVPLMAKAAEIVDDNYEYGAVDAPIGIAVAGGILAILTALLPVAMRGGEEAFEEIKDRDQGTFGKKNTDLLKGKRK